jgi:hypothetical protein
MSQGSLLITLMMDLSDNSHVAAAAKFTKAAGGGETGSSLMTPAEDVRRRYRTQGFNALLLDEQQWTM